MRADLERAARSSLTEQRSPFWYARAKHARHEALTRFSVNLDLEQATVWWAMVGVLAHQVQQAVDATHGDIDAVVEAVRAH